MLLHHISIAFLIAAANFEIFCTGRFCAQILSIMCQETQTTTTTTTATSESTLSASASALRESASTAAAAASGGQKKKKTSGVDPFTSAPFAASVAASKNNC